MQPGKKVGIWIRVSTDFQVKDESPEVHEKRARMYAEAKEWNVVEFYRLDAVSGKSVIDHPEAKRMLSDIRSGKITGLIFTKLARLARNTRQLLEFAEIFRENNADLISLNESIDTSTSAGRFFFTLMAALGQWEREEIADRVAGSVPIRAKMGKSLGGAAPYGYRWQNKQLVVDQHEGPIRKLMYELFIQHKRKSTVATILNEKGYRTRNGSKFSDTTIDRLLHDPIAKGHRRSNYTKSLGENKKWVTKPETDWVINSVPELVSEETWNTCNQILQEQESQNHRAPAKKAINLFSGILSCYCGGKMYVPTRTTKYVCNDCKRTHISSDDLEEIYFEQLKSFLLTKSDLQTFLVRANEAIQLKLEEVSVLTKEKTRLKEELDKLVKLHSTGQLPTEDFGTYFRPIKEQTSQLEENLAEIQGQLDFLKTQQLNGGHILENAENLYDHWPTLEKEAKRSIIEELTKNITIENENITISFCYTPLPSANTPKSPHNHRGSWKPPT
ncbi:MAG TPA: recombinase family protein [Bacteroidia bacterium]|nr:recombinase family protein [Bacteroidia bacterium]